MRTIIMVVVTTAGAVGGLSLALVVVDLISDWLSRWER